MRSAKLLLGLSVACASGLLASSARATSVFEFPDNGSEQMARGGAWVARASDPLATIFNPAGLAGQPTRLTLQSSFIIEHTCFSRIKAAGDTSNDPLGAGGVYPRVCNDIAPTFNPQIGATIRVNDRLGVGLLVIGPASGGEKTFPDFVRDGAGELQASPARYLLAKQAGIILSPTLGVGAEIVENLRVGASFSWGFARLRLASATVSLNSDATTPGNDTRANLQLRDYFIPAFTVGGLWSAAPEWDLAGWYKWSDAIRASGDVGTAANFYTRQNANGDDSKVRYGDTIFEDCGTGTNTTACGAGNNGTLKFAVPMEAKIGVRYHKPRAKTVAEAPAGAEPSALATPAAPQKHLRDPLATDVFDVELDLTWANNSAADAIEIRFPSDNSGTGLLPVAGVQGGQIPPNADQRRNYRDVIGVRLGGDWNVIADKLALRAGSFFESSAANPQYQHIDFQPTTRFGLALGGTYRIRFGEGESASALELMVGYGHVFFGDQSRTNPNDSGLGALAGTSCNGSAPSGVTTCADGNERYRTKWPVNLGTITSSLNVVNVGAAYRF
ncbi:MAG: hypothetical protein KF819_11625 [Labilithrix sp.]|nr:hypothetical protein [Labilithrix sp.]